MAILDCQIERANDSKEPLSVGEVFSLACHGAGVDFNANESELRLDEADKYKIKLLKYEKTGDVHHLQVTSYMVGEHMLKAVQLVDTKSSVVLSPVQFTVASVQDPKEPKKEPYGPRDPMMMSWPWTFWAGIIFGLLVVIFLISWQIRRQWQKRKLVQQVLDRESKLPAHTQFHQTVRQCLRGESQLLNAENVLSAETAEKLMGELDRAWKIYLTRTLLCPAHVWPDRLILKFFKKINSKFFADHKDILRRQLAEVRRAQKSSLQFLAKDFLKLADDTKKTVDLIETGLRKKRGAE